MKIGVTGTRSGMNDVQLKNVMEFFQNLKNPTECELHHGDCIGVDVGVAIIAHDCGLKTVCHPPENQDLRAFHKSDLILDQFSYFKRNRHIVDATDLLLVVPYQSEWQSHGGTWYTHDYAKKNKKELIVFYPHDTMCSLFD